MPCLLLLRLTGIIAEADIRALLKRDLNVFRLLILYMLQINPNVFKSPPTPLFQRGG